MKKKGSLSDLVLLFVVFMFFFLLVQRAFSFTIQSNPPINLEGYVCDCGFDACFCRQGEITFSVDLTRKKDEWEKYASKHCFLGICDKVCSSYCVDNIGIVTSIKVSYLTLDSMRSAVRKADYVKKKSMSFTERITNTLTDSFGDNDIVKSLVAFLKGGEGSKQSGTSAGAEDVLTITKEKAFSKSESESESIKNDLTVYLLTQITRDFFELKQNEVPKLSQYAAVISLLSDLNREGKVVDFISSYLYLKSKNKPVDFYSLYADLMNQKNYDFSNMTIKIVKNGENFVIWFLSPDKTIINFKNMLVGLDLLRYYILKSENLNNGTHIDLADVLKCSKFMFFSPDVKWLPECVRIFQNDFSEEVRKRYANYYVMWTSNKKEFEDMKGQEMKISFIDDTKQVVESVKHISVNEKKEEKKNERGIFSRIMSFLGSVFILALKMGLAFSIVYGGLRLYKKISKKKANKKEIL